MNKSIREYGKYPIVQFLCSVSKRAFWFRSTPAECWKNVSWEKNRLVYLRHWVTLDFCYTNPTLFVGLAKIWYRPPNQVHLFYFSLNTRTLNTCMIGTAVILTFNVIKSPRKKIITRRLLWIKQLKIFGNGINRIKISAKGFEDLLVKKSLQIIQLPLLK